MLTVRGSYAEKERVAVVAEQLHFVNVLAGNDPIKRNRAMKKLRRYLQVRLKDGFRFTHDDFLRIWKGLFYCMWMSDKPLVQEELSEEISHLVHALSVNAAQAMMFIKAFYSTLLIEWYGIDHHRMDKFLMFVRRFLRQSLFYCKRKKWEESVVNGFAGVLKETILCVEECEKANFDVGLIFHFCDIFVEELSKVGAESFPSKTLITLLEPFAANLKDQSDERVLDSIRDKIFYTLIEQSPKGLEYEEKFQAWKRAGFPGSSWEEMQFVGKSDKRSGVLLKHLDPRAGKVDVYLPRIQFNAKEIAKLLRKYGTESSWKTYINRIAGKFDMLAKGQYPLAQHISKAARSKNKYRFSKKMIDEAAENLVEFEKEFEIECKKSEKIPKRKLNDKDNNSKNLKKIKLEKKKDKEKENCQLTGNEVCNDNASEISSNDESRRDKIVKKKMNKKNLREWNVEEIKIQSSFVKAPDGDDESDLTEDSAIATTEKCIGKVQNSPSVQMDEEDNTPCALSVEDDFPNDMGLKKDPKDEVDMVSETTAASCEDKEETCPKSTTSSSPETPTARIIKKGIRRSQKNIDQLTSGELDTAVPQTSDIESENTSSEFELSSANLNNLTSGELDTAVPQTSDIESENTSSKFELSSANLNNVLDTNGNEEEEEIPLLIKMPKVNAKRIFLRGKRRKNSHLVSETNGYLDINEEMSDCGNETDSLSFLQRTPLSSELSPKKRRIRSTTPSSGKRINIVLQMNKSQAFSEYVAAVRQSPSVPHDANKKPCKGVLKRTSIQSPINPFYRPPKGINKL